MNNMEDWKKEKKAATQQLFAKYPELSSLTIVQLKEICKTENIIPYGDKANIIITIVDKRKRKYDWFKIIYGTKWKEEWEKATGEKVVLDKN